jgi:hypothetical protein
MMTGGWLLAPGWQTERFEGGWEISKPKCGRLTVRINGSSNFKLTESKQWCHPEFGLEQIATRLEWSQHTILPAEITTIISPQ